MEEEKRVPNYNPREDDKEYIGTKLLDGIERGASSWYKDERTLEGWEYLNPLSVATATAIRGVEGVGFVLGNTPVAGDLLKGIGWAEDRLAEGARNVSGALTPDLDPRFAGWGTRLGTAILADKGIRKVAGATKATLREGAERAAVRSSKKYTSTRPETMSDVWRDDLAGPRKTFERTNKRGYYPENPPADPWMDPKEIAKRNDMQMSLFNYIDSQANVPIPPNPTADDLLNIHKSLPIVADEATRASHVRKLRRLKLGAYGSVFHREELSRVSKRTGLGQLTRREAQTISNESVKNFTKRAPERVAKIDELREFYSNLSEKQIIPELDHVNPLKLSAYLMDGQDLAGRRQIRKIIYDESGLYTGDDVRNLQALPREVHHIWSKNMDRVMGKELEIFIGEMVEQGITDPIEVAKVYAKRIKDQRIKFNKAYEAHKITHGVKKNPVTGKDIINRPEDISRILDELADIDVEDWGPKRIRDISRQALGDANKRDLNLAKDVANEAIQKRMRPIIKEVIDLNNELDTVDLSDQAIKAKLRRIEILQERLQKLEDKRYRI